MNHRFTQNCYILSSSLSQFWTSSNNISIIPIFFNRALVYLQELLVYTFHVCVHNPYICMSVFKIYVESIEH